MYSAATLARYLDDLHLHRIDRVIANQFLKAVEHRDDKTRVLRIVNRGDLVNELCRRHKRIRPAVQERLLRFRVCAADDRRQLAAVIGKGMNTGACQLHFVNPAVVC